MKTILVTDSLFIFPEQEQKLRDAGYELVRLDKPDASEDELCKAVKGKAGYILGGIEKVTKRVIDAADSLEAIVFTGIGYKHFIPGWEAARDRGITIGNVPDGPTHAVAEWSLAVTLAMNRGLFELAGPDGKAFLTTQGLESKVISIVGLGRIGGRIAEMIQPFRPGKVMYYSTHRHPDREDSLGLVYGELDDVLRQSDVVYLCVPIDDVGDEYFTAQHIAQLKENALVVNINYRGMFDVDALYGALQAGKVRMASDYPMDERFDTLPRATFYCFRASNAFNTSPALAFTSDSAALTLINLLATGKDKNRVV